ncbi:PREDICTED: coiled-coil domain-containing protein 149 isoform X2 [Atta colombica]|uniref:coiled-coil domain-containing protein 149 isoform X2 n=1 Tax=Atta colombica TaxID=520822 RepID=UPI00084C9680|nr:PREDICTED: coiled-coil domain-containing protein 149 isoform X2 [Atta colombica]
MEEKRSPFKEIGSNDVDTESKTMLKRKLQMKSEALILLSKEMDQSRIERDQFKLMAEQIQERFLHLKKQMCDMKELNNFDDDFRTLDLLTEAREQNKCLRLQVETLRQKLTDAEGDIKVLRTNNNRIPIEQQETQLAPAMHQREEMIEQLEKLNLRCSQLQTDLQTVLDEKHELKMERDAFKCKAHRLNHELSKALNATKPIDLDALINENRYLQERLQQLLEEKELTRQSLSKYKSMLDSKRAKGTIKLGANSAVGTVMTHKQVEQLLQESSYIPPQKSAAAVTDLRCLCTALLEALNDKTLALAHQKKANKILALRICELDSTVQSPTTKLLEGYTSNNIDLKCDSEFNNLDHTNSNIHNIEENVVTNEDNIQCSSSPENQIMQQLQSIQMSLPRNLGVLVQKALNNLNDKQKQIYDTLDWKTKRHEVI